MTKQVKQEQEQEQEAAREDAQEAQEAQPPTEDQEAQEGQEGNEDAQDEQEGQEDEQEDAQDEQADTFPREYVEKLRKEAGDARTRAKRADELAAALWAAQVAATGQLADPSDLPMPEDADPLDPEAASTAVAELLAVKPHLAARVPRGFVGQGQTPTPPAPRSLGGLLRGAAG